MCLQHVHTICMPLSSWGINSISRKGAVKEERARQRAKQRERKMDILSTASISFTGRSSSVIRSIHSACSQCTFSHSHKLQYTSVHVYTAIDNVDGLGFLRFLCLFGALNLSLCFKYSSRLYYVLRSIDPLLT